MNSRLPEPMKARLKAAFAGLAKAPGVRPEMIRGYGGKRVDGYDTTFSDSRFGVAAAKMALVTDQMKGEMLKAAARR
jgi:phosphonate transport system substrate-binding protein